MTAFFTGYIALGTNTPGSTVFVEATGTSYARQAITLNPATIGQTTSAAITWTAGGTNWPLVTSHALFAGSSGGAVLGFYYIETPFQLANSAAHTIPAGTRLYLDAATFNTTPELNMIVGQASNSAVFAPIGIGPTGPAGATGPTGP